jgi:bla regulator protein BlaR1
MLDYSFAANHLWQSTLFAGLAGLLTLSLRKNHAGTRHAVWLAASVKFLIPFALLISAGGQLGWLKPPVASRAAVTFAPEEIGQRFPAQAVAGTPAPAAHTVLPVSIILVGIWICGAFAVSYRWTRRWLRVRATLRAASPLDLRIGVSVMSSPALLEPGVFGIWRPVLLLPAGIVDRLTPQQLQAILTHELCHVRRRDNLTAAIHMMVEAIFWFHPLVWWLGARLVEERERACDEEVLRMGNASADYAEGILNVCKLYLESPLVCISGVTGSDLRQRIERIMVGRVASGLSLGRKLLLAAAGFAAVAAPIVVGIMDAPARAQSSAVAGLKYEVAVVRPAKPDDERGFDTEKGRFMAHNVTLMGLVARAYDLDVSLISGGPKWAASDRYDINAKFPDGFAQPTAEQGRQMLQNLLAGQFQLAIHREPGQVSGYALVVAKNGPKMEHADPNLQGIKIRTRDTHLIAENVSMEEFAKDLKRIVGKLVADKTGLSGYFKFELDWTPERPGSSAESSSDDRPSIFTALQERLGLRLESAKIPVSAIVVDRAEKPAETSLVPDLRGKLVLAKAGVAALAQPILAGWARATQAQATSFEVASIRPSQPGTRGTYLNLPPPGREFTSKNVPLSTLIQVAYHIQDYQLSGGPGWMASGPFDIAAKADHDADREEIRRMLQALLADRFKLAVRRETKELPIYELVVGKNGSKLPEAAEGDGGFRWGGGRINGRKVSMEDFVEVLSVSMGRPVLDRTALTGIYDIKLQWTPAHFVSPEGPGVKNEPPIDPDGPSIFTAIQEQLGLKLEARKGPVETIVVEHAERPSEN